MTIVTAQGLDCVADMLSGHFATDFAPRCKTPVTQYFRTCTPSQDLGNAEALRANTTERQKLGAQLQAQVAELFDGLEDPIITVPIEVAQSLSVTFFLCRNG